MKKLVLISIVCCLVACKNGPEAKEELQGTSDIFPITSFLAGQVHVVDSLKLPLRKYSTINDKTDTLPLSIEEFKALADEFMEPDINTGPNKKFYKESSFADQSIPSVTITYAATVKTLEIQRIDVIIHPDPVSNDKVQSIYMEKLRHNADTSVLKKLFWRTDKNFQIVTSTQVGSDPVKFSQLKVSWSNED